MQPHHLPPAHPSTPSLISFDASPSNTQTPTTSSHFSEHHQSPPAPTPAAPPGRPRALSLLDEPEDEPDPQLHAGIEAAPSALALSQVEIEPAAFATRRQSQSAFYEGNFNPQLGGSESRPPRRAVGGGGPTPVTPHPVGGAGQEQVEEPFEEHGDSNAELYIPGLTSPNLFSPLPVTDGLTPLLEKYLAPDQRPKRDMTGEWRGSSVEDLISARRWRSLATFCRDTILLIAPEQTRLLLSHWSLRHHSLLRLHLYSVIESELNSLFDILPAALPLSDTGASGTFHDIVPFEFYVVRAVLPGLSSAGGERGKEKTVEELARLIRACKRSYWSENDGESKHVWKERIEVLGGMMSKVLLELKAPNSATALLRSAPSPASSLLPSLLKIHISTGNLSSYSPHLADIDVVKDERERRKLVALGKVARGEWVEAEEEWTKLVEEDKGDLEALNNLAVVLLFSSKLQEAIQALTTLISTSPALAYSSESLIFNLCTLLELRTDNATREKIGLLRNVTSGESAGEGIRPTCFKLVA